MDVRFFIADIRLPSRESDELGEIQADGFEKRGEEILEWTGHFW